MQSGRPVLEMWFDLVWAQKSDTAIEAMFKPEGEAKGLGAEPVVGPAEFKLFRDAMLQLAADVTISISDHFNSGEMNVAICTLKGSCIQCGKAVSMDGCCYYSVRDGVITRAENYWEFMNFFEAVCCIEKGAFGKALTASNRSNVCINC